MISKKVLQRAHCPRPQINTEQFINGPHIRMVVDYATGIFDRAAWKTFGIASYSKIDCEDPVYTVEIGNRSLSMRCMILLDGEKPQLLRSPDFVLKEKRVKLFPTQDGRWSLEKLPDNS